MKAKATAPCGKPRPSRATGEGRRLKPIDVDRQQDKSKRGRYGRPRAIQFDSDWWSDQVGSLPTCLTGVPGGISGEITFTIRTVADRSRT